jgi:hypothetical protein
MAVYRQSVRLSDKPIESHNKNVYFSTEHLRLQSLCNILSYEKMSLSFTIADGPPQRQVRVPRDSWPHFTVSDSRLPKPGRPHTRIYISQELSGPVISPGAGFPYHRLLRLAWLRWRYSTPPLHRILPSAEAETYCRHGHSWHRAPLVPRAIDLFNVKIFAIFSSLFFPLVKGGGLVFLI